MTTAEIKFENKKSNIQYGLNKIERESKEVFYQEIIDEFINKCHNKIANY
jgi:hypothetical protein